MDTGRYMLQQGGWDSHSALESYNAIQEPEYRVNRSYGGRGVLGGGFGREPGHARQPFRRDILLERDGFRHNPPVPELWPPTRRSNFEDEFAIARAQRHDNASYIDRFREFDNYRKIDNLHDVDIYNDVHYEAYRDVDGMQEFESERAERLPGREFDSLEGEDHDYRRWVLGDGDETYEHEPDHSRDADRDSDKERERRNRERRRQRGKDKERRGKSRERDRSPARDRRRERSHSHSHDDRIRRSHSPRSHSRGRRGDSQDETWQGSHSEKIEKKKDRDEKWHQEQASAPSATVVVKGLSQKTVEDDLYRALMEWGPLRHVRVIKERNTGISRGFAFIDFLSVEAAQKMMDGIGEKGLVLDGRRIFFEYSSKPTGGLGAQQALSGGYAQGYGSKNAASTAAIDWMCTICGCVNFARRTLCFQCNEGRAEDAPPADVATAASGTGGKRGSEAGPTHVLVVRGLDEHVHEEMLHYEFSKHAPIKDLRLVRDKFTHISRGFAFVHFHSVDDATKALEATNGVTLEKNGQVLRVAYAKSIHGPCSSSGTSLNNSLAAAAIEAATFAQQYDSAAWAPKEYNPDHDNRGAQQGHTGKSYHSEGESLADGAPQSGFVWDEASGYYYDASSGFYYDGHRGLYYDGNNGVWYSYDHETQQYVPYVEPHVDASSIETTTSDKDARGVNEAGNDSKSTVSATAATVTSNENHEATEKKPTLAEAVQAAALAALAATKKDKEKLKEREKELRLASKSLLLANKKKISSVMNLWKQRQNEGQVAPINIDESSHLATIDEDKHDSMNVDITTLLGTTSVQTVSGKKLGGVIQAKEKTVGRGSNSLGATATTFNSDYNFSESGKHLIHGTGVNAAAVGRGVGRGIGKADSAMLEATMTECLVSDMDTVATPFKTDASALGTYGPMAGGRRRFSEAPQSTYRDRAAERRSLYGSSSSSVPDAILDFDVKGTCVAGKDRVDMPFPPGVGIGAGVGAKVSGASSAAVVAGPEVQSYEVITSDKAIDERNVGNRMLRNMGWQEGSGLGKDGTGIVEPVQALTNEERAGLGSQVQHRKLDSRFETQPGDSYRVAIQKKALARFHDMM